MTKYINVDSISGLFLIALGGFTTLYALANYDMGTLGQMGPGMYPAALGALLASCGAIIFSSSLIREGAAIHIDLRALIMISLGVLIFAFLIDIIGLVGATFALILMSNMAIGSINPVKAMILAVAVSAGAVLIFRVGLGIPLDTFRWPL